MSQDWTLNSYDSGDVVDTDMANIEKNLECLRTCFSGASAPSNTIAGMWWFDTNTHILKQRNEANDGWLSVWDLANNKPIITNLSNEITVAMIAASAKDPVAGTPGLRTLGTGAQQACAGNDSRLSDARTPTDASVSQSKLKTSTGSVSTAAEENLILPGGEYGFYPQTKSLTTEGKTRLAVPWHSSAAGWTSYRTNITLAGGGQWVYVQQRYITSSGEVFWIFLLRDKQTKEIISAYQSPDHPCFGNGGKPLLVPHPFGSYDPEKHEIIVINPSETEIEEIKKKCIEPDPEYDMEALLDYIHDDTELYFNFDDAVVIMTRKQIIELYEQRKIRHNTVFRMSIPDRDLIDVIWRHYEIDEASSPKWPDREVTVGLPPDKDWKREPDGTPVVPIKKKIPKPAYIMTRSLRKKK